MELPWKPSRSNAELDKATLCPPYFCFIDMEYLSRILKAAGEAKDFYFHPRCSKLKLNHLVFVDDLMLFCKEICIQLNLSAKEWSSSLPALVSKPTTPN